MIGENLSLVTFNPNSNLTSSSAKSIFSEDGKLSDEKYKMFFNPIPVEFGGYFILKPVFYY